MRRLHRCDFAPRLEMTPLIDVIFLLLTFFIYQMIVMRPVDTLGFELAEVAGGQRSISGRLDVLSIDGDGALYLNREPIPASELDERLAAFAADPAEPTLYITMEADGRTDRGPLLFNLLQRVQAAGIRHAAVVGQPGGPLPPRPPNNSP
jgi:biopolymer transport protein ExbD